MVQFRNNTISIYISYVLLLYCVLLIVELINSKTRICIFMPFAVQGRIMINETFVHDPVKNRFIKTKEHKQYYIHLY